MSLFNTNKTRISYISTETGEKVYPVLVDVKKGVQGGESIQFVSSDINTGMLSVAFMLDNADYNISGTEVICTIQRPDATILEIPCKHISNNVVEVYLGVNGTSQGGTYTFDFKVYKGGDKVVGTPILSYTVSQSISSDNSIDEDDRLPVLNNLIIQVNNAVASLPSTEQFHQKLNTLEQDVAYMKEHGVAGKGEKGDKGDTGLTPDISIGNVTTLEPNQQATVTRRGTNENPIFDFGIPKGEKGDAGSGGSVNNETLLARYVHSSNKVIQPIALDFATGVFTSSEPHGLTNGTKLLLDFTNMSGGFNQTKIPKELFTFNWTTWYYMIAEVVSETQFKVKSNVNNSYITFSASNTPNLDLSSFRFQVSSGKLVLNNIGLSAYKKIRINMNFYTLSNTYVNIIKIAKLTAPASRLYPTSTGSKMARWLDPSCFMYPNKSFDVGAVDVHGNSATYRHDIVENILTLKEDVLEREVNAKLLGYANTHTTHDNNSIFRAYNFIDRFEECGYSNGNKFLDSIEIPDEHKLLNDSVIEIYGLEV